MSVTAVVGAAQDVVDVLSVERHLRQALAGVRLVAEVDLEGDNYDLACSAMQLLIRRRLDGRLGKLYPATAALYLVAEGVHRYSGGTYWPELSVRGIDQTWMGPAFILALEELGLPSFERETSGGFKYIAKILLHGGIPRYCAADVLRKLIKELRRGATDAHQIVTKWRTSRWDLVGIDKPAQRFLLHGGRETVDLIDRVIEMLHAGSEGRAIDPAALGVPAYLVAGYEALSDGDRRLAKRVHAPRPVLHLDPYTGEGPELLLPQASVSGWLRWNVRLGGGGVRSFEVSRHRTQYLPVDPPGICTVACVGTGQLATYELSGPAKLQVLFFDPRTGVLLRNQERLRGDAVLALAPESITFRVGDGDGPLLPDAQELPPLHGQWSRHQVRLLDLRKSSSVWVGPKAATPGLPRSEGGLHRRRGRGTSAPCRTANCGRTRRGSMPDLRRVATPRTPGRPDPTRFRYRALIDGVSNEGVVVDLPFDSGHFDLGAIGGHSPLAVVGLEVLGPLGSDLRTSFLVVEGLDVSLPDRVLGPGEPCVVGLAVSDRLSIDGGQTTSLTVLAAQEQFEVVEREAGARAVVTVSVPRLQWSLRQRGIAALFGETKFSISVDEITTKDDEAVLIRTVRPTSARFVLVGARRRTPVRRARRDQRNRRTLGLPPSATPHDSEER